MRRPHRVVLLLVSICLPAMLSTPAVAGAASPWWHVDVGSRPSTITPGSAQNAVQVVTVGGTGGQFVLRREENVGSSVRLAYNATASVVQSDLEGLYGAGTVQVAEGAEDTGSLHSWTVTFTGSLGDQPITQLSSETGTLAGAGRDVNVVVQSPGRPDGQIVLTAENIGDGPVTGSGAPVVVADTLPAGVKAVGMSGWQPEPGSAGTGLIPMPCSSASLTCTFAGELPPYEHLEVRIDVVVEAEPVGADELTVTGGEAPSAFSTRTLPLGGLPSFGMETYEMSSEEEGGAPAARAGSHPFQLTTTLALAQGADGHPLSMPKPFVEPVAMVKDINARLPVGVIGNPQAIPHCSLRDFLTFEEVGRDAGNACPPQTAVGVASVLVQEPGIIDGAITFTQPIFNLEPEFGEPARFGFYVAISKVPVILDASLRSGNGEDYGITISSLNTTQEVGFLGSTLTFWGTPGDVRHDNVRGWGCLQEAEGVEGFPCKPMQESKPPSFLTLPTSCSGPLQSSVAVDSWLQPSQAGVFGSSNAMPAMDACNRVQLNPSVTAVPTTESASSPTGLRFNLDINDEGIASTEGLAESQVNKVVVALPEGMTANPSLAAGLSACSEAQYASENIASTPGTGCPEESEIGNVEVSSPLLEQTLRGGVYIAKQNENPFHSLLALYVVVKNPETGVLIKLAGHLEPNPVTGQLVSVFENLPQLPFSHFSLSFRQGQRSPLISPPACGTYTTQAAIYPWSAPQTPIHESATFEVTSGVAGTPCPAGGTPPFDPRVTAGTLNNSAGSYSPFDIDIARTDSEQEITGFSSLLPPGVIANLTGVPFCSEADIALAKTKTGAQEEADPSCPAASQIGHTLVGVGVASVLAYTPGKLYMAGPFEGASFSVVAITNAKVGPFDLGTVVVHLPLRIDPRTATVSIPAGPADQIPHIIDGIVVHVRDIRVYVDRPGFTLNPTDCQPLSFSATVIGSGRDFANPGDDDPATVQNPFQAANCANLAFKPTFKASTSAGASRKNGSSLRVLLTYPNNSLGKDANIKSVHVELPKALPSRLETLKHACLDTVFDRNPADCPSQSRIGVAKAVTPVLPVPLEGPAYFVSHGGAKWPELIVVLQGYGVTVDLQGETFISGGITSSTFKAVPDVPVRSFELTLPEGPYSALAANGDFCTESLTMPTVFDAQNGARLAQTTPIEVEGCPYRLRILRRKLSRRSLTLRVSVPAAGRLLASGRGVSGAAESSNGRQTLRLTLKKRSQGKLRTRIDLRFTPNGATGRQREKRAKILRESVVVTFR